MYGEVYFYVYKIFFPLFFNLQATGGQDSVLRIWVLKSAYSYFEDLRQKYVEGKLFIVFKLMTIFLYYCLYLYQ